MTNNKGDEGLKRVIGVPGLALSIVNGVIGSGIFVLPAIVGMNLYDKMYLLPPQKNNPLR